MFVNTSLLLEKSSYIYTMDQFTKILKEQEKALFTELIAIQRLIELKGEKSNYLITEVGKEVNDKASSTLEENRYSKVDSRHSRVDGYLKSWTWTKKTKFAFEVCNRRASAKQIIDFITSQESNGEKANKTLIASNVYNVLSKLYRKEQYLNKIEGSDEFEVLPNNESGVMPLHKIN
jgi:hypothetical protein